MVTPLTTEAQRFIATCTGVPGLQVLWSTASAHGARLISGGTTRAVSTFTTTTSLAAPMTTGLPTTTTSTTPAMPATAMAAAGAEHLAPAPGTSKRAHHAGRAEHHRNGSQFHRLTDRVGHLQDQQGHRTANSQQVRQDRNHGVDSARQHQPLETRDARGAYELPLHDKVL